MARAMGAEIEILPLEASDSSSPTMCVDDLGVVVDVGEGDGRAEGDLDLLDGGRVDDLGEADAALEVAHTAVEQRLALLGGVVLGVLTQVAVVARGPRCRARSRSARRP
jgi:hypothetical protein